ncbi:MAG: drug/metabolite transporter (DMT)-like permease [Cellvibrionaceae bacterium]|jgi:drug/metabolite transporter (DMT)-like permease
MVYPISSFLALRFLIALILLGGITLALRPPMPKWLKDYRAVFVVAQPVLTILLATRFLSMKLLLVALLGFVGLMLVLSVQSAVDNEQFGVLSYFPVIVSVFAITYGTIYQKKHCLGAHIVSSAFLQYIPTGIAFMSSVLIFENGSFTSIVWHIDLFFASFWLAIVLSIGAVLLINILYQNNSANVAASYFYLSPPFTLMLA